MTDNFSLFNTQVQLNLVRHGGSIWFCIVSSFNDPFEHKTGAFSFVQLVASSLYMIHVLHDRELGALATL